ncbi:MAG: 3-phosphoshikimate 1-carboxyvinyltransferase [Holophagaceae bacterium]|nr:3-phosphoshikimate 1-carboxyvinyltransferase [Holophagaceae bacterium]
MTNRALLLAALTPGTSHLQGGLEAEDTRWMRQALRGLGIPVVEEGGAWRIQGGTRPRALGPLWLGASGTTLRFLLPWLALCAEGPVRLEGDPRLFERPLGPLLGPLEALGARWSADASGAWLRPSPVPPKQLNFQVDARLSSQFLSGLALAAAGLSGPSQLTWEEVASPSYLTLTTQWLQRLGCAAVLESGRWQIPGGRLQPRDLILPGDWSGAAAFLAAAGASGRRLEVGPLDPEDAQGDRAMVTILEAAGCAARWIDAQTLELQGPLQRGLEADLTDCPDLGPVLAALAALAPAPSELRGLHTLPHKECDRLDASAELVRWLGGQAEVIGDHTLRIAPGTAVADRSPFSPRNDHRMAFAAALGGLRWGGELRDPQCVAKTFPDFWGVWRGMLGC